MTKDEITNIFNNLDELQTQLYNHPDGGVGGPLHIITDDSNIEDHHVLWCWRNIQNEPDPEMKDICTNLLLNLRLLSEPQRMLWWLKEQIKRQDPNLDILELALKAVDAHIEEEDRGSGLYTAKIKVRDEIIWSGLY